LTGVIYLLIIIGGLYSGIMVRNNLIDYTNATVTAQNIIEHELLYRIGFLADFVMVISDVIISVLFFFLLKQVNKSLAIFATVFRLIQSAILGANLINLFSPLIYLKGYAEISTSEQELLANLVLKQLQIFELGYLVSGVFFSFNCFLMGYLLYKSNFIPKAWGAFIFIAGVSYFTNCLVNFLFPQYADFSQLLVLVGAIFAELSLCLYLLIKGVRIVKTSYFTNSIA